MIFFIASPILVHQPSNWSLIPCNVSNNIWREYDPKTYKILFNSNQGKTYNIYNLQYKYLQKKHIQRYLTATYLLKSALMTCNHWCLPVSLLVAQESPQKELLTGAAVEVASSLDACMLGGTKAKGHPNKRRSLRIYRYIYIRINIYIYRCLSVKASSISLLTVDNDVKNKLRNIGDRV